MSAALTPELALSYVRELSADIRDGVVLDASGECLAGTPEMAAAARDLLAVAPEAVAIDVITKAGTVFAARSGHHGIAVACGPHALPSVIRFDLRTVLDRLRSDDAKHAA